jgi:hypothetical protein
LPLLLPGIPGHKVGEDQQLKLPEQKEFLTTIPTLLYLTTLNTQNAFIENSTGPILTLMATLSSTIPTLFPGTLRHNGNVSQANDILVNAQLSQARCYPYSPTATPVPKHWIFRINILISIFLSCLEF